MAHSWIGSVLVRLSLRDFIVTDVITEIVSHYLSSLTNQKRKKPVLKVIAMGKG